jgi:acyl-CoA dehydrogenase
MELATYYAAWRIDQNLPAAYWVAAAKVHASDGYRLICFEGHEVHAGIGFMREYDLQLYYRRAKVAELEFGDGTFYRREMVRMLKEDPALGRI